MLARAMGRLRNQPRNKWVWYEICKAFKPSNTDELVKLTGLKETSFMLDGFKEWRNSLTNSLD